MPGSKDERDGAKREGVIFSTGWGPDEILIEDGKLKGLRIKKVESVFNGDGQFAPSFVEGETRVLEGDVLFMAVGQTSDLAFLDGSGVETERGIIKANPDTFATNIEGIYAGGDIALGPKLFIDGIESGSKAALAIDAHLNSKPRMKKKRCLHWEDCLEYDRNSTYVDLGFRDREEEHIDVVKEPERNSTIEYDDKTAHEQSLRCLACHIHPTFEGDICILCGGCVDVCPSYCLRMVHISAIDGDADVEQLVRGEFGEVVSQSTEGSAMLFDPLKCIRCGMCSIKCPTGSCKMSTNSFRDTYVEVRPS